ncbi:hypothetical protein BOTCAL_0580g00020 [Botryotinia calthae]|uniref:Uncharacterized protein n=1 Tax=Botryotinia calthae TaxID=38488 RepID=A0A4Y8CM26_9HELO|nr:hypothetical protein BOTCAL_0580g00020 [Botryotinia calthae]
MFRLIPVPDRSSNQVCDSMDPRFNAIPRIMGRDDVPVDVHEPPDISATPSVYRDLFRIYRVDSIFQSGPSKQAVDLDLGDYSNNLLDLVSGQLLSNGLQWSSTGDKLWG